MCKSKYIKRNKVKSEVKNTRLACQFIVDHKLGMMHSCCDKPRDGLVISQLLSLLLEEEEKEGFVCCISTS